ncbi:MAG: MBOAT family O-acyltransferase [Pirellulaceae bacterium]
MYFNSVKFVFFFVAVYSGYLLLSFRLQNLLLLAASYFFYASWNWKFLSLIIISTCVDYAAGLGIERMTSQIAKRRILMVSLIANLGLLAVFKYYDFFIDSLLGLTGSMGIELSVPALRVILPVGISFYTFQTLSYTIDIYRGELKATKNFLDFALFVAYFPQLVAGPIERASVLLPQLATPRTIKQRHVEVGSWLILSGYFFKCVLSDNLAPFAKQVFETPDKSHGAEVLVGIYAAAFQIYGDFAGYSRIARGISMLMGIDLMQNFNRPYFAENPSDFWRRWHISLSTWLRDYLYIPLGGNRGSRWATYRNLLLTMLLGGLWHGAAWHFVAWGAFHGIALAVHRFLFIDHGRHPKPHNRQMQIWKIVLFFHFTCIGWLIFFVPKLGNLPILWNQLVYSWEWNGLDGFLTIVVFGLPVLLVEWWAERSNATYAVLAWRPSLRLGMYAITLAALILCGSLESEEFIYFQF